MSVLQSWDTGYSSELRNKPGYMLAGFLCARIAGFLCARKRKKEERTEACALCPVPSPFNEVLIAGERKQLGPDAMTALLCLPGCET